MVEEKVAEIEEIRHERLFGVSGLDRRKGERCGMLQKNNEQKNKQEVGG